MTLRNFPAPSQKTLGGCVTILASSSASDCPIRSRVSAFSFTRRHPFLLRDFIHPKRVNGKQERKKQKKKLLGMVPCAHKVRVLRIPKPSSAAERLYLPRRSSVFLTPTHVTVSAAGQTDKRTDGQTDGQTVGEASA